MSGTLNLTLPAAAGSGGTLCLSSEHCSFSAAFMRPPNGNSGNQCRASMRASALAPTAAASSFYEVLRIKQSASAMEIKTAYRSLAKVYHPDSAVRRPESDDREFIEIHDAYETLSDPAARAIYDLSLTAANGGGGGRIRPLVSPNGASGFYRCRRWETDQCW